MAKERKSSQDQNKDELLRERDLKVKLENGHQDAPSTELQALQHACKAERKKREQLEAQIRRMKASYEDLELKKENLEQEMCALLEKLQSMMVTIKREADGLRDEMQQTIGQVKLYKEENETLKAQLEKQRKEIAAIKEEQIVKADLVKISVPNTTDTGSQTHEILIPSQTTQDHGHTQIQRSGDFQEPSNDVHVSQEESNRAEMDLSTIDGTIRNGAISDSEKDQLVMEQVFDQNQLSTFGEQAKLQRELDANQVTTININAIGDEKQPGGVKTDDDKEACVVQKVESEVELTTPVAHGTEDQCAGVHYTNHLNNQQPTSILGNLANEGLPAEASSTTSCINNEQVQAPSGGNTNVDAELKQLNKRIKKLKKEKFQLIRSIGEQKAKLQQKTIAEQETKKRILIVEQENDRLQKYCRGFQQYHRELTDPQNMRLQQLDGANVQPMMSTREKHVEYSSPQEAGAAFEAKIKESIEKYLSMNKLEDHGITVDFNKNCRVTTFRYCCRDCHCRSPTKLDCHCSVERKCEVRCDKRENFRPDVVIWYKQKYWAIIELKNHDRSAVTKEEMLKLWKDRYRLNENKAVVCGGAAMYVSETTIIQPVALKFAKGFEIPVYYENDMDITVLVEQLIQDLWKKESELQWPVYVAAQPRAQQQPWPTAYL